MTKEDLKGYFDKGVAATKEALEKAGKAASKFGDESILKIEIQQLKSQIKKDKIALGNLVCEAFLDKNETCLSSSDENVVNLLESIKNSLSEIKEREEKLKDSD